MITAVRTPYDDFMEMLRAQNIEDTAAVIRNALPPDGLLSMEEMLEQLDKLKGWLDSFRPLPADVLQELKRVYDVRFTFHSNAIEGNTLTQSETELVLEKGVTVGGKTLVEHLEAIGHRDAIDYIEEMARTDRRIGEREIRDLHVLILRGVDQVTGRNEAGRYRTLDVRAAGTEHAYPPHYRIPELMEDFCDWLNDEDATEKMHPVVFATEVHYRFVAIHPFRDGNGRTARLLMNLFLLRAGYPITVITNDGRQAYIDALVHAQDNSDDTELLTTLVADACRESLIETLRILSTAESSQGKGLPFYQDMLDFLASETG